MNITFHAPLRAGAALLACLSSVAAAEGGFTLVDGDKGSLSIYGTLDGGLLSRSGENGAYAAQAGTRFAGHKSELASGIESESRIGLKGSRDLRNGLTALFQLEAGIAIDDGKSTLSDAEGNSVFRRKSFVGLAGSMGTVVFGRIDGGRYSVAGKYDPFANGTVANMASIQVHGTRADNAVAAIEAGLDVEHVHRPALPARDAGGAAGQFGHDHLGIDAIGQHMQGVLAQGGGDLHPGNHRQSGLLAQTHGFRYAFDGIVIRERQALETMLHRQFNQFRRPCATVGIDGMGMQINTHGIKTSCAMRAGKGEVGRLE